MAEQTQGGQAAAASSTPARDAAEAARRPMQAVKAEASPYVVFELQADTGDLARIAKVKATGRPEAVNAAIDASPSVKERLEKGEEIALLPIAARLLDPLKVKVEVRRERKIG